MENDKKSAFYVGDELLVDLGHHTFMNGYVENWTKSLVVAADDKTIRIRLLEGIDVDGEYNVSAIYMQKQLNKGKIKKQ